jgi:DnaA-homolog protein
MKTTVSAQRQLPLRFVEGRRMDFELFVAGPNAEATAAVSAAGVEQAGSIYLSGPSGTGKSHLLLAACQQTTDRQRSSALIPLREVAGCQPQVLDGLESMGMVCLDDIDLVAGDLEWERAIFNLYNRCREAGSPLLLAGRVGPANLGLSLKDLLSRLEWGLVFQLKPLTDADKLTALRKRAVRRGLQLSDDVGRFMLQRLPRDMTALMASLERLDEASLVRRRRLTIPLLRELFRSQDAG